MRRLLLLVRHAKSAWDDPALADHDRPLAPRGVKALPRLCEHLVGSGIAPDLVLCSSARRAVDTLEGVRGALPESACVEVGGALYAADAGTLGGLLRDVADDVGCVMLVGHNPAIQELAVELAGAGEQVTLRQLAAKLPTAAAVTLSFDSAWTDLGPGVARVDDLFMARPPRP